MKGLCLSMLVCVVLAGCGLGETAATAPAVGTSQAEQAQQQGPEAEARPRKQVDVGTKLDGARSDAEAAVP